MKKVLYIPTTMRPRTRLDVRRPGDRSTGMGINGWVSRLSSRTKAANRTSAAPPKARVWVESHPYWVELTMA